MMVRESVWLVEDDDRVVERIADHRQHRCDDRQIK